MLLLVLSLLLWCIPKWYIPIWCIPISCLITVLYHMFYCVTLCILKKKNNIVDVYMCTQRYSLNFIDSFQTCMGYVSDRIEAVEMSYEPSKHTISPYRPRTQRRVPCSKSTDISPTANGRAPGFGTGRWPGYSPVNYKTYQASGKLSTPSVKWCWSMSMVNTLTGLIMADIGICAPVNQHSYTV